MDGGGGGNAGGHGVGRTDEDRNGGVDATEHEETGVNAANEQHVTRRMDGGILNVRPEECPDVRVTPTGVTGLFICGPQKKTIRRP